MIKRYNNNIITIIYVPIIHCKCMRAGIHARTLNHYTHLTVRSATFCVTLFIEQSGDIYENNFIAPKVIFDVLGDK